MSSLLPKPLQFKLRPQRSRTGLATPDLGRLAPAFTPRGRSLPSRFIQRDAPVRRLDWLLFLCATALSLAGSLLVWSATRNRVNLTGGDQHFFLKRHLLNLVIGLALAAATMAIGHRRLRAFVPLVGIVVVVMLMAVLSPLGSTINGAKSWIQIGAGFSLQPSEFAKIAILLGMAMVLSERVDTGDLERPGDKAVALSLCVVALPIGFILMMPDLGSTMVICVMAAGILLVSGARVRWILGLGTAAVVGALAVWKLHLLSQYQLDRFAAFANPNLDPAGVGYNTHMARIAIGSGGLLGKGLFHGTQTNGQFVPEQQTDFVFSVAGEELGFVGCAVILALFAVLLWRGVRIAVNADDLFGTCLAAGVVAWLGFQMFENAGMNVGIMPVAGVPLPFVSYGGSSMFAIWIAIGLLESVHMRGAKALASSPS